MDYPLGPPHANQYLAFVKLCNGFSGLYIWEFFTTLDYEWSVIQGRRPYRWTIWVYSFTRVAALLTVILTLACLDSVRPINCQLILSFTFTIGYLSHYAAQLLIMLRTIAIWNKNKTVIVLATSILVVYPVFIIQAISQLRSAWSDENEACSIPKTEGIKFALIIVLTLHVALVFIKFLGLFRLFGRGGGIFGLGRLLWKQGVIWLLVSTGTSFLVVLLICLDLSPPLDMMFTIPSMISTTITATRMYASLTDFSSSTNIVVDSDLERGRAVSDARRMSLVHVTVSPERHPTSQFATLVLDICHGGQPCDESQELSLDDNVHNGGSVGK